MAGRTEGPEFPPLLARQGSLYNLTLDEVQSQLGNIGKPLNCMKLGELLRNLISVEEMKKCSNLNETLSKKTVDEVWKEIVHQKHLNAVVDNQSQNQNHSVRQRLTLGGTTLEDFLVGAGVINVGNQDGVIKPDQQIMAIDPMVVVSQQADWFQYQMAGVHQQQQQQQMTVLDSNFNVSESVYENPVMDVGYSENQLAMSMPMPAMSATSSESQVTAQSRKRRCSDEMMEKTIERRQKRMIKNRESAARSRARKQAYTNQLEQEVLHMRKTNNFLKKQKEVEILLSSNPTPMPKYQLRRTSSASF